MKTLYIECKMGAAGDMLMSALYELCTQTQKEEFLKMMEELFKENYHIHLSPEVKQTCGITGTHMKVLIHGVEECPSPHDQEHKHEHHHTHHHSSYPHILSQIQNLNLPESVKQNAMEIYKLIGTAESKVHGCELSQIHFHEVGSLDALADVVGCCLLLHLLSVDCILTSPVHVGNGTVHCAHGILPVPAPATAEILKEVPYYTGNIPSELCTPTGAAVLKHFSSAFTQMPVMQISKIGIGIGTKEFEQANCIRCFLEESSNSDLQDEIAEIFCNIDDMTGEALGFAMDLLLKEGALDVFFESIQMKKNRPGILLHCICPSSETQKFILLILTHTTSRGVRYQYMKRQKLDYHFETISTPYGDLRKKISEGYGIRKEKFEYEDIKKAALTSETSFSEIEKQLSHL